ncbi:Peroxide stress-activated histidine kinase mak2 [Grifola frondosa]|uniref:Peroxide stress-activated histidine kinase mak2 n=1 Tax=Grifola frondosa TaxID=5627 RepID=A0A1C7MSA3_GRIFR|nr:Peroxide stress-activated histidine kinase mak2 [Grifola frondosa]
MRRKYTQPGLPTLYFKEGILSVPGYTFEKAVPWEDTGSMTLLAEGTSLQDGTSVLAKIAPAHSNASMCLEREAHILERMSTSPETSSTTLRMIDFFTISRGNGDCVVLLLVHPGLNILGRYFPPLKVNNLLLGDISRAKPSPTHRDIYMMGIDEPYSMEEMEAIEIMDLATFLEFAIQATHCLEMMHRSGLIHREVRANAFHLNHHSGLVRLVHFGNRAVSLEQFGVPSEFVLKADAFEEVKKFRVKEALCYLAPEQTGSMESLTEDHRTDLYSLGVMFWTLLVGRGTMPFEGGPLELLHAIVQKRPMPVHEVRRDVPQVLAMIIEKLLSKTPDARYQSAHGLKADLIECQRRLLTAVALVSDEPMELIPYFDIAMEDRYLEFTIPSPLFGRDKELETIRNIIRHTSTSYSRHIGASRGSIIVGSSGSATTATVGTGTGDDPSESMSSKSEVSGQMGMSPETSSPKLSSIKASDLSSVAAVGHELTRWSSWAPWSREELFGLGQSGQMEISRFMGPSQVFGWRSRAICFTVGLHVTRAPTAHRVPHGPSPLLYEGAPELRDILALFDISIDSPEELLETNELRARFQSLVENVFSVLAETRLFALFLDDLHEASESSLDLINSLVNSRSRILIFATVRSDKPEIRQHHIKYDWDKNYWDFDIRAIESRYLIQHLREIPEDARKYIIWASFFGPTFKVTEVALMMDWEDSSGSSGSEEEAEDMWNVSKAVTYIRENALGTSRVSMRGLQTAIAEGWLVQRARDMCSFAHDRYRQAAQTEAETLSEESVQKMSFRVRAEHAKRCLPLLRVHAKRDELLELSIDSGDSARARGAHELALQSYLNARSLLDDDSWRSDPARTASLYLKLAELYTWKSDFVLSDNLLQECLLRVENSEDKARLLRLRSRNHGCVATIQRPSTIRSLDYIYLELKYEAWWSTGEGFADVIGLTTIQLALRSGMCPGTALGFFWALGAAAERRELFRFSADLGKLALRIAEQYGTSFEKCRALLLFSAMVSGFDNVHIRANLARLEEALKYGQSSGDRVYTSFSSAHMIVTRLYICDHISELVIAAEESLADIKLWTPSGHIAILAQGTLNCIRAMGGFTLARSAETAFDTANFKESEYLAEIEAEGNLAVALNWYNSFKLVGYFCLGYVEEAAALGFYVYETRDRNPNYRHTRYALFFHSLAMINCLRKGGLSKELRNRYLKQIEINQSYIRKWLSPSPINTSAWVALVDAEMASLFNSSDAFKLYDVAVKLATNNDWLLEGGWGMYLQGCHFVRCGVEGLGGELQRRGIARHAQWGARGIVDHLSSLLESRSQPTSLKRHVFAADVAVQTDSVLMSTQPRLQGPFERPKVDSSEEDEISSLTAADLASVLKWSKEISGDINLSMALQRLTEIATETSGSQNTCVVIAREAGDYTVATSMNPPESCQVHENPMPIRAIADPLRRTIIQNALNSKERIYYEDVSSEPRFSSEAQHSPHRSVICLPIFSNRGQTFGAVYLASKYAFSPNTVTILTLLCQQASIGISNALLFRSVQAGTRENLKMISAQRDALEAARRSREDALKATKIKSNFLASMSHELRTPFSSFYGLLDILSGTELNAGQREIVQTAKQSCELLLKIIDSILDYSKLEASALKLEFSDFSVENMIADCMELLLPMAAKKLDLSYNIEPDVPPWVKADYARIRQVLMNLIGNAVKFTANGSVRVICSVDAAIPPTPSEVHLKFGIQDTGIGLSSSDVDQLFVPFQQADNSSTRRFGGTGLEESQQAFAEVQRLKSQLMKPHPLRILISSVSSATLSLLSTMLSGFYFLHPPLDFVILDDQSESRADDLARTLQSLPYESLHDTKIIHLFTPTTDNLSGAPIQCSRTPEEEALSQRTLYGNVLVAEDNPVAQKLLMKQLERYDLKVVATSNGEEAITEWESHEPGYFSVALFDHHMPICDGVEACKRVRVLENKRRVPILLPIVALSADCQESTKQLCLSAGMNAFLSKPLKKYDLLSLLTMFAPPTRPSNTPQ